MDRRKDGPPLRHDQINLPEEPAMTDHPIWDAMVKAAGEMYRGFHIYYDPPPIPTRAHDWHFVSDNYDAESFSDGSHSDNGLCGDGPTMESCVDQIDEMLAEQAWERARSDYEDMGSDE
jgi:hypothetical protein